MKPNFALSLSFEGISLLHRAFPGWNRVGEVALDSPDLAGALAVLRETAEQINGQDVTSKLVIPNDQIKYLSLDLGILAEDERRSAIRTALEGATPYPVDDLEFDWSVDGNTTQVAAVAKETLAEAESFAQTHGFGPLCFVAIPPEGQFAGEPFFGATQHAATVLGEGEQVQRDMAAIRVTGVVRLPDPGDEIDEADSDNVENVFKADQEPDPETPPEPEHEQSADTDAAPELEAEAEPENPPVPETEPEPLPIQEAEPEPQPEPEAEPERLPVFGHTEIENAEPVNNPSADDETAPEAEADLPVASVLAASLPEEDDPADDAATGDASETSDTHIATAPAAPSFASMRAHRDDDDGAAPALSGVRRDAEDSSAPSLAISAIAEFDEPAAPAIEATPESGGTPDTLDDVPPMPPYASATEVEARHAPEFEAVPVSETPDVWFEPQPDKQPSFLGRSGRTAAAGLAASLSSHAGQRSDAERETERQRMTVFGARKTEKSNPEIGGKPRHLGLILSVLLLLFLAGIAAWASIFMDEGLSQFFGAPRETEVVVLPDATVDELDVEGEEAMVPTSPEPDSRPVETAALTAEPQPEEATPPALLQPTLPHALTEKEAQTRYAVTGVWQRAPQAPQLPDQLTLDDLYVTSIDPGIEALDAVALPESAALSTDFAIDRVPLPAARGTRFQLDDRGLVVARAEGALSPEGFLVFAGRPKNWPAALPQRLSGDTPSTTEEQQRLSGARPKARPGGLVEQNERTTLGGLTRAELAGKRPKARPDQPAQKIEEEKEESGSEFAVAESRKPKPRPSDFAKLVERTRKTEQTTSPRETTQVAAAVPRSQATAPAAPSKASVAQAATVRNQINLRKINLIGVYGKPSSRRALVRLANGRYKKVQVGDRLDGGRVQSIGDGELRYTRNGRSVVLKMPKG